MQIKLFTVPIIGGETIVDEMNSFLRSKRVLTTENQLVNTDNGAFWCFCIKYLEETPKTNKFRNPKVDYKEVLDDISFQRFSKMREIRKQLSKEEGIPAYVIFTDEELAGLAKIENLTAKSMQTVKGVGVKKVEKYSKYFIQKKDEKS